MIDVAETAARMPLDHLSVGSLNTYLRCPEKWRRRYMEHEFEPVGPGMVVGSAAGEANNVNFRQKVMSTTDLATDEVLDAYSDEFEMSKDQREIDWQGEKPGDVKDSGAKAVKVFHEAKSPEIQPVTVERKFSLGFADQPWTFVGFIDIEDEDGDVDDLKVVAKRITPADAHADPQATAYLAARRAEGNPARRFKFQQAIRTKTPAADTVETTRTDVQLDNYLARVLRMAAEIAWRIENDVWSYAAPGAWWCSQKMCGFWPTCPAGGAT